MVIPVDDETVDSPNRYEGEMQGLMAYALRGLVNLLRRHANAFKHFRHLHCRKGHLRTHQRSPRLPKIGFIILTANTVSSPGLTLQANIIVDMPMLAFMKIGP